MHDVSPPSPAIRALFASVMVQTQGPLYSFVRGLVGSAEQARDIVQDVFVDAWRAARSATPTWLATIRSRCCSPTSPAKAAPRSGTWRR